MHIRNAILLLTPHIMAIVLSAGFLIGGAMAVYVICAAVGNDFGGPMVPLLIPLFAVIGGVGASLGVYFPLSLLFQWISRKAGVPAWLWPFIFFGMSVLFFLAWLALKGERTFSLGDCGLAVICGLFFSAGFAVYWVANAALRCWLRGLCEKQ